jgi:hypothetical protein
MHDGADRNSCSMNLVYLASLAEILPASLVQILSAASLAEILSGLCSGTRRLRKRVERERDVKCAARASFPSINRSAYLLGRNHVLASLFVEYSKMMPYSIPSPFHGATRSVLLQVILCPD